MNVIQYITANIQNQHAMRTLYPKQEEEQLIELQIMWKKQVVSFIQTCGNQQPHNCGTQCWNLRLVAKITMETSTEERCLKLYKLSSINHR